MNWFPASQQLTTYLSTSPSNQTSTAIGQTEHRGQAQPPHRPITDGLHNVPMTTVPPSMQQHCVIPARHSAASAPVAQSWHSGSAQQHSAVAFDSLQQWHSVVTSNCSSLAVTITTTTTAVTSTTTRGVPSVCTATMTTTTATAITHSSKVDKLLCPDAMLWQPTLVTTTAATAADYADDMSAAKLVLLPPPSSYFHLVPLISPPPGPDVHSEPLAAMYVDMATIGMATLDTGVVMETLALPMLGGGQWNLMSVDDEDDASMAAADWSIYSCLPDHPSSDGMDNLISCRTGPVMQQASSAYLIDHGDISADNAQSKPAAANQFGSSLPSLHNNAGIGCHADGCYGCGTSVGSSTLRVFPNPDPDSVDNLGNLSPPESNLGGLLPAATNTTTTTTTTTMDMLSVSSRPDVVSSNIPRSHTPANTTTITPCCSSNSSSTVCTGAAVTCTGGCSGSVVSSVAISSCL